ncbi:MAG TPA: hypothetical protein VG326_10815 [Tepidisphaeraceae bacterium]|nr:hypothetical protein [Tepidisphaeraceae bacterium]
MNAFSDELRLVLVLLLNIGVLAAAYRLVVRRGGRWTVESICDALLLYFLVEYAAVAIPGVIGVFSTGSMCAIAVLAIAVMEGAYRLGWRSSPLSAVGCPPSTWTYDHYWLIACTLFTAAFLLSYAYLQRFTPPVGTDALVYHLPTAVQWIQTGRLGIYPSWYWNPAASYSPGTGAIFMAWWMAPAGNDVFVRFVQLPPLMFIYFLVVRMSQSMGATRATAGFIGLATALSRPLFSEAVFQKDDLFVTAFVVAAVLSLVDATQAREHHDAQSAPGLALPPGRFAPALSPWRVGVAFGFVLASKYTALLACPIFLFMIDAPFRAGWRLRHWIFAAFIAVVMAGPWYFRNVILTGNPLYPVDVHFFGVHLQGLFSTERDEQLRSAGGIWRMLAQTYHSVPSPVIALLLAGWACAVVGNGKAIFRDPLRRACTIGSVATIALFLATSPHHEVRYLFPLIVLLFANAGAIRFGFRLFPNANARYETTFAAILAVASVCTAMDRALIAWVAIFSGVALAVALAGVGLVYFQTRMLRLNSGSLAYVGAAIVTVIAIAIYVDWHAYVEQYREIRSQAWAAENGYPVEGPIWKWVDENTPADASLAYANTFFVYPYYGFNLTRQVGYAPVRRGVKDFLHFPRLGERIPGDLIVRRMTQAMDADPDRDTWLANLRSIKADYLIVMKGSAAADFDPDPPELGFARQDLAHFGVAHEDAAGVVFRIDSGIFHAAAPSPSLAAPACGACFATTARDSDVRSEKKIP